MCAQLFGFHKKYLFQVWGFFPSKVRKIYCCHIYKSRHIASLRMICNFMVYLITLRLIVVAVLFTEEDLPCTRHYAVHFHILSLIHLTKLQDWSYYPLYTVNTLLTWGFLQKPTAVALIHHLWSKMCLENWSLGKVNVWQKRDLSLAFSYLKALLLLLDSTACVWSKLSPVCSEVTNKFS